MRKKNRILDALMSYLPTSGKTEDIEFKSAGELTLGAEIELQIIDPQSFNLASRAEEIFKKAQGLERIKPELYLSTVEINTDKCENVHEVEEDLREYYDHIERIGGELEVKFATTGCHPFARYDNAEITPSPRYNDMIDRNQWLLRRQTVYGLHVHIGMKSGDDCIRFNNFFAGFTAHLLALSASSPFWQGRDTGLASCRPTTFEALPTAGQPYNVRNWREFESLYYTLKKCDSIRSLKDLWWDLRPSPNYGTLEIRVCDGPATLDEALAITAYIHLLAHWFRDNGSWLEQVPPPSHWQLRENKWRVMRHGLEARLVKSLDGDTKMVRDDIGEWLEKLAPYIEKLGYGKYVETIRNIMSNGNSSARQRAIYEKTASLEEVSKFNTEEFFARSPLWAKTGTNNAEPEKKSA